MTQFISLAAIRSKQMSIRLLKILSSSLKRKLRNKRLKKKSKREMMKKRARKKFGEILLRIKVLKLLGKKELRNYVSILRFVLMLL